MIVKLKNIKVWDTAETIDAIIDCSQEAQTGDRQIDASGWIIAPGFADPHIHLRDPGQTEKENMITGCAAAASGGYTGIMIMPNTIPAADGTKGHSCEIPSGRDSVLDYLENYEQDNGCGLPVRYCLCVCASKNREGKEPTVYKDWEYALDGHSGGFKHPVCAISDDGSAVCEHLLAETAENVRLAGIPFIEHCEHHDSGVMNECETSAALNLPGIPEDTELAIVQRDIDFARKTGIHVHFQHISTAISVEAIRKAKEEGLNITCETAPHYISLNDSAIAKFGTLAKMNPPLRGESDRQAIIAAIADGTIDFLATDHAPHTLKEKSRGMLEAPNGIIGMETAYPVAHKVLVDGGFIDDKRLIELMSVNPARFMGLAVSNISKILDEYAQPATENPAETGKSQNRVLDLPAICKQNNIAADSSWIFRKNCGGGAEDCVGGLDFVIVDPNREYAIDPQTFKSKARNTPFANWRVTGKPLATIIGGKFADEKQALEKIFVRNGCK